MADRNDFASMSWNAAQRSPSGPLNHHPKEKMAIAAATNMASRRMSGSIRGLFCSFDPLVGWLFFTRGLLFALVTSPSGFAYLSNTSPFFVWAGPVGTGSGLDFILFSTLLLRRLARV